MPRPRKRSFVPPPEPVWHDVWHGVYRGLIERRHELGLSQDDLDAIIGCADGLVSKWECGMRRPTRFNLACWARALGCRLTVEIAVDAAQVSQ